MATILVSLAIFCGVMSFPALIFAAVGALSSVQATPPCLIRGFALLLIILVIIFAYIWVGTFIQDMMSRVNPGQQSPPPSP